MRAKKIRDEPVHMFAAMGDKTRLHLLSRLGNEGARSITELATGIRVSRQAVTKHLEVLEGAGLIHASWQGRERIFELDKVRFEIAQKFLERMSNHWDIRLNRLRKLIED